MIRSFQLFVGVSLLVAGSTAAFAQPTQTDAAVSEAVRRQADTITLTQKLAVAQDAARRGDLEVAAKTYEQCVKLVEGIGSGRVEAESAAVVSGLTDVRLQLAEAAQKRGDLREADVQVSRVLKVNPNSERAIAFKAENDKRLKEMAGMMPDQATQDRVPQWEKERIDNSTKVQNAKLMYENGKYAEAEKILNEVLKDEPGNYPAAYYLSLIKESNYANEMLKRETTTKGALLEIERAWEPAVDRLNLPVPNPIAHTNLIHTSKRRQVIASKLDRIHLDNVLYDGLPLSEVIRNLSADVKRRDPDKQGINFIIAPQADGAGSGGGAPGGVIIDPATGLPVSQAPVEEEPVDLGSISIKINPALGDVRLVDLLEILVKVAERPIKYSVEDYGIVFSVKAAEQVPLHTRIFRVDPNTFWMGLQNVTTIGFADIETSSGSGGGGGGGGNRGGGGNNSGGGNNNSSGGSANGISVPRVNVAGGGNIGGQTGGGLQGAQGGGQGGGGGLPGITERVDVALVQDAVRDFFGSLGVDLNPPKAVFFNDRHGTLFVHATMRDLDIIEQAIQVLNIVPPQINIQAKFAEITQNDRKALGFDWYLGNVLIGDGKAGFMGGTAPSFNGAPSQANPNGFFPGTSAANTIPSSASDQLLTAGLRNTANAPALMTLTGILTDPQFRVVIRALEQREGVEVLTAPDVTTVSGRQAQLQAVDVQTIVTGNDLSQNATGGGDGLTGGGGGGAVGSTLNYQTSPLPFGPVLDVIPYVSADGYTVQMALIPTVTEFLGYDDPGAFVPQAQSVSSGAGGVGLPITAQLPLPRFRVRQVTTTSIVWDGQTIALGGLLSENVSKTKDKVPVLGDVPFLGRFFRSESSVSQKKNLVIFVTPTIIDPAGNRMHSDDDLPFRQNAIPKQAPVVSPTGRGN
jgi:type II secretory pathway component GspD/PulD (secretin)/tetratricopeptide (TPR) repeat protein